jgi:3-phenylpropionate/trans-cinnamate dioxygenase ferredoxin subunit
MSQWVQVGTLKDMPEDQIIPVSLHGTDYILIRRGDAVSAFLDLCSHQQIKLSEFGEIQRGVLVCHAHGAAFDCENGQELCFPASAPLQSIPTRIHAGQVEISL